MKNCGKYIENAWISKTSAFRKFPLDRQENGRFQDRMHSVKVLASRVIPPCSCLSTFWATFCLTHSLRAISISAAPHLPQSTLYQYLLCASISSSAVVIFTQQQRSGSHQSSVHYTQIEVNLSAGSAVDSSLRRSLERSAASFSHLCLSVQPLGAARSSPPLSASIWGSDVGTRHENNQNYGFTRKLCEEQTQSQ